MSFDENSYLLRSQQEFTAAISIWLEALRWLHKQENQLRELDKRPSPHCLFDIEQLPPLTELISADELGVKLAAKDYKSFKKFAELTQEDDVNSSRSRDASLFIGFPVFQFYSNSNPTKITSLINIKLESVVFDGDNSIKIKMIDEDQSLFTVDRPELEVNVSSYVWEDILDLEAITFEKFFSKRADIQDWLQKILLQLGISNTPQALSNLIAFRQVLTPLIKPAASSAVEVLDSALIFYQEDMLATAQLQSDLSQLLKNNKYWSDLPKKNPGLQFVYGSQDIDTAAVNLQQESSGITKEVDFRKSMFVDMSDSQRTIAEHFLANRFTSAIGPPGVGKTTLIKHVSQYYFVVRSLQRAAGTLFRQNAPVVIASLNNLAVDQAIANQSGEQDELCPYSLRLGNRDVLYNNTLPTLRKLLETLETSTGDYKALLQNSAEALLAIDPNEISRQVILDVAREYHHYFVLSVKNRVVILLLQMIREIEQEQLLKSLQNPHNLRLLTDVFPVLAMTLLSIRSVFPMDKEIIDLCMIDEVGQCFPMHLLPLLLRSKKSLLIGDIFQNVAFTSFKNDDWQYFATKLGLDHSFDPEQKLINNRILFPIKSNTLSSQDLALISSNHNLSLKEHFRCHPDIIGFCQELCGYDLNVESFAVQRQINPLAEASWWYFDVHGKEEKRHGSWVNNEEAETVISILEWLLKLAPESFTVSVLTPFRAQQRKIQSCLTNRSVYLTPDKLDNIKIATINSYQGQECDLVIFSPTLVSSRHYFLNSKKNYLNIVVSRASQYFITVGAINNLRSGKFTAMLYKYINRGRNMSALASINDDKIA